MPTNLWQASWILFQYNMYYSLEIVIWGSHSSMGSTWMDTVMKVQVIIDFLGHIIYFSGPHIGSKYDGNIYVDTCSGWWVSVRRWPLHHHSTHHHPSKAALPHGGSMCDDDNLRYVIVSHYRSRVEHVNRLFEAHALFKTTYCGDINMLHSVINVTMHTTNIECCKYLHYKPFGPWTHFPV